MLTIVCWHQSEDRSHIPVRDLSAGGSVCVCVSGGVLCVDAPSWQRQLCTILPLVWTTIQRMCTFTFLRVRLRAFTAQYSAVQPYLLLHKVHDVLKVQVIVVVHYALPYVFVQQLHRLQERNECACFYGLAEVVSSHEWCFRDTADLLYNQCVALATRERNWPD